MLLTPLATKNIPPPMFATKVDHQSAVMHVSLFGDGLEEKCLSLLCDNAVACHGFESRGKDLSPVLLWNAK